MKAYMFINSMRGQSLALTRAIRGVSGVLAADAITGDYDIIASVEVRDLTELRHGRRPGAGRSAQDHHLHGAVQLLTRAPRICGRATDAAPGRRGNMSAP
jgi:hypothetical protein